ncbi:hypothetical protein BDB01DRAFT_20260 [Pilobolus umbonatus]|nr:hypothetical protein BDB01DRAFT_20260 [Pilobolus umbonatus]
MSKSTKTSTETSTEGPDIEVIRSTLIEPVAIVTEKQDPTVMVEADVTVEHMKEETKYDHSQREEQQFISLCRRFFDIRNTLLSIGHSMIPPIPSMVIMGNNNAKSKVIESIVGSCIVTSEALNDHPIEIDLINTPNLEEPFVEFGENKERYTMEEALEEINKISTVDSPLKLDSPMKISVYSSTIPYMRLISIPFQHIQECGDYLADSNTTLIAVHDVTGDPDPILSAVHRKYDPLGRRTIGVLAKKNKKDKSMGPSIKTPYPPITLGYLDLNMAGSIKEEKQQQKMLRNKVVSVLEQTIGKSIYNIVDSIEKELEETRYQFKVIYNDREISAHSYLTESMDELKLRFKEFATLLKKPELRKEVRTILEQNVLNVCADQYWSDPKIAELHNAQPDDFYWLYKMDLAASAITRSGIGRITTQTVIDVVMNNMKRLVEIEPFQYHSKIRNQIIEGSHDMLRMNYMSTSDQVENTIKPFKYEVEVTDEEWRMGVRKSVAQLEKELEMCESMAHTIKRIIGRKRLRSAIQHVLDNERNSPEHPVESNNRLLEKAKEALFLQDRAMILRYRIAALRSRQCNSVDNKHYCPEAFLNIIAEKLTFTAVMFIQIELLNDFFTNFPVDVLDNQLIYSMNPREIEETAKENPLIQKHLTLQERKSKLEKIMDVLDYLVKRHETQFLPSLERQKKSTK